MEFNVCRQCNEIHGKKNWAVNILSFSFFIVELWTVFSSDFFFSTVWIFWIFFQHSLTQIIPISFYGCAMTGLVSLFHLDFFLIPNTSESGKKFQQKLLKVVYSEWISISNTLYLIWLVGKTFHAGFWL